MDGGNKEKENWRTLDNIRFLEFCDLLRGL